MNFYEDSIYLYSSVEEYKFGNDEVFYKFDLQMETWQVLSPALTRPSYKALRYSCIYQGEFYLFFGLNRTAVFFSNEIYKYNIKNQSWALVSNETGEGFVYGSFVQADNIAYFLYGRNSTNIKNSLMSIDLSTMPLKKVIITGDWVNPSARKFHCGNVINTNMIIFAGMTETIDGKVEYFNDMWKFDLLQHSWRYVTPLGEIPEKRALFGCSKTKGSIFAVFGGKGKDSILDDLFIYYDLQEMWYQITPVRVLGC
jgi:N-acetylneuraminic acid mutarotase